MGAYIVGFMHREERISMTHLASYFGGSSISTVERLVDSVSSIRLHNLETLSYMASIYGPYGQSLVITNIPEGTRILISL